MKKLLKFLNKPLVAGILKSIPLGIGSIASNVLSEANGVGRLDKKELPAQLIKIGIYAVLLYLVFSGKLNMSDATEYQEFLNN